MAGIHNPKKTIKSAFTKKAIFSFIPVILIFSLLTTTAKSQGNLLVTPKRVVFEGGKRSEELNIANTGKDSATYIISFIQIRMKEDGTVEQIQKPDSAQNFADKYLRFFPRRVILAPNEAQTVKVQFMNSGDMAEGEYRSHMYFRAVPNEKPLGESEPSKDTGISVKLVPVFGISLPVIVRHGESSAKLTVSDLKFKMDDNTQPALYFTFNRTGNMSVYGNIAVEYIAPNGKTTNVGMIKGLAVYTPNALRKFKVMLDKKSNLDYHTGKLHLVYTDESPRQAKLAEQELALR